MTTTDVSALKKKPRWRFRRSFLVVLALGLLFLAWRLVWFYVDRHQARQELDEVIAELDRSDPDWRWQGIHASRRVVRSEENGALVVKAAYEALPKNWNSDALDDADEVPPPSRLSPRLEARVRVALESSPEALALARTLARYPTGRIDLKWSPRFWWPDGGLKSDHYDRRDVARLLALHVHQALQERSQESAWHSCRCLMNLARSFGDDPTGLGMMARLSVEWYTTLSLERTLARGEIVAAELAAMQSALEEEAATDLLFPVLHAERATKHDFLCEVETGRLALWESLQDPPHYERVPVAGLAGRFANERGSLHVIRSHIWLLRQYDELLSLRPLKGFRRYQAVLEFETSPAERWDSVFANREVALGHFLFHFFEGRLGRVATAEARQDTRLACAWCGLAAERFRLKKGRWPESLAELVENGLLKEIPEDHFDGQTVRFRRTADGLVIYSVGKDGDYRGDALDDLEASDRPRIRGEFRLWDVDRRGW